MSSKEEKMSMLLAWISDHLGTEFANTFARNEVDDWDDLLDDENVTDILDGFSNIDIVVDAIRQIEAGTLESSSTASGRAQMFHDFLKENYAEKGYSAMLEERGFVQWDRIVELTKNSLKTCGVSIFGHRKNILQFLTELKDMEDVTESKDNEDGNIHAKEGRPVGTPLVTRGAVYRQALKVKVQRGEVKEAVMLRSDNLLEEFVNTLGLNAERMFYVDSDDEIPIRSDEDLIDASRGRKVVRIVSQTPEPGVVTIQTEGDEKEPNMSPLSERLTFPPGVHVVPHQIVVADRAQAILENPALADREFIEVKGPDAIDFDDDDLKAILVVGETGAGKSTLINSLVNVLYDVRFEDDFRLELIADPPTKEQDHEQTKSQTNQVFGYYLQSPPLLGGKSLLIVDTPGFGDTRGPGHDEEIRRSIKEFFETKIDYLNAVCFVVKAPQVRLTFHNKYIFDKVLGLFGKEIEKIIMLLFTFADGEDPPAKAAVEAEGVEYACWFPINNSGFSLEKKATNRFARGYWDIGINGLAEFLHAVVGSPRLGLEKSKEVLRRREELQASIGAMREVVHTGLTTLDSLAQTVRVMEAHAAEMKDTEDFEFEVTETRRVKKPKEHGSYNTICQTCKWTCHPNCAYDNAGKKNCSAMGQNGYCSICPDACHWNDHINWDHYWAAETYTVKKTKEDLKRLYCTAESNLTHNEQIMKGLSAGITRSKKLVYDLVCQIKDAMNEVRELALRPGLIREAEYFDRMIEQEMTERKDRWEERVAGLKRIRDESQYLREMSSDSFNPFDERLEEITARARPLMSQKRTQPTGNPLQRLIRAGAALFSSS